MTTEYSTKMGMEFYVPVLTDSSEVEYQKMVANSEEEAQQMLSFFTKKFEKDIKRLRSITGYHYLLSDWLKYYFEELFEPYHQDSTYSYGMYWAIYKNLLPAIQAGYKDVFLEKTDPSYLEGLLKQTDVLTDNKSSLLMSKKALKLAMEEAYLDGHFPSNPMDKVDIAIKKELPEVFSYQKEDLAKLYRGASHYGRNRSVYLELLLMGILGLRSGEVLGLRESDLDRKMHAITVQRQITRTQSRYGRKTVVKDPKTEASYRKLIVPETIWNEILSRIKTNHKYLKEKGLDNPKKYLCLGRGNHVKGESTLKEALHHICLRENIPYITPHGLRHMAATMLFERYGLKEIEKISKMLGHSNIYTTFNIYIGIDQGHDMIRDFLQQENPITALNRRKQVRNGSL